MDGTKTQRVDNGQMRFQTFNKRHQDAMQRYVNNMPVQHAKDRETDDMLIQRVKAQQSTKPKPTKQVDNIRRFSNQSNESSNSSNMNGVFNNNDILQQVPNSNYFGF